jgi:hypothetical protein
MPVIGRLDRQVNDVLIEPLDRKRARAAHDTPAPPDDATPGETKGEPPRDEDRRREDETLPVWLL